MEEHASVIPYAEYRAALGNNCRRSAYGGDGENAEERLCEMQQ